MKNKSNKQKILMHLLRFGKHHSLAVGLIVNFKDGLVLRFQFTRPATSEDIKLLRKGQCHNSSIKMSKNSIITKVNVSYKTARHLQALLNKLLEMQ